MNRRSYLPNKRCYRSPAGPPGERCAVSSIIPLACTVTDSTGKRLQIQCHGHDNLFRGRGVSSSSACQVVRTSQESWRRTQKEMTHLKGVKRYADPANFRKILRRKAQPGPCAPVPHCHRKTVTSTDRLGRACYRTASVAPLQVLVLRVYADFQARETR